MNTYAGELLGILNQFNEPVSIHEIASAIKRDEQRGINLTTIFMALQFLERSGRVERIPDARLPQWVYRVNILDGLAAL
jgi:Fe2+ or Zn2+ uptake regulation protein